MRNCLSVLLPVFVVAASAGALKITSVSPASGSILGGTTVTIGVSQFVDGPGVTVHMPNRATVISTTSSSVKIFTPAYIAGLVNIEVIDHDGNTAVKTGGFEYFSAPTITSIVPASGALAGGNHVRIYGKNFYTGGAEVRFGNTPATEIGVYNDGSGLYCTSPPGALGPVTVTVTNLGSGSATTTFTYQALSLTSVAPDQGPAVLNNEVVLKGRGFSPVQTVYFGGVPAVQKGVSSIEMTVWSPYTQTPSAVDVTIKSPDGSSATLPVAYGFRQSRPVFDVNLTEEIPSTAIPTSGHTWISITGQELDIRQPTVLFGRTPALAYNYTCNYTGCAIHCLVPPGPAGPVDLTFIGGDGGKSTLAAALTYVQSPANDDCASAYPVIFDGPMYFELNNATPASTECIHGEENASVWYQFTPRQDGYLDVYPAAGEDVRIDLMQDCCGEPLGVPTGCVAPTSCLSDMPVVGCEHYLVRVLSTHTYPSAYDGPTTIYAAFRPVPGAEPCAAEGEGEGEGATEGAGEGEGEGSAEGEGEGGTPATNAVDTDHDGRVSLSELLRLVQFYRLGIGCGADTEDGYAPGSADHTCAPYSADYNPRDWQISLSEALRVIQLYIAGAYHPCPDGEDGLCPGAG